MVCKICGSTEELHKQIFRGKLVIYSMCQSCYAKTRSHASSNKGKTFEEFYGIRKAKKIRKKISARTIEAMKDETIRAKTCLGSRITHALRVKNNTYKGVNLGRKLSEETKKKIKDSKVHLKKRLGFIPGGFVKGKKNVAKRPEVRKKISEKAIQSYINGRRKVNFGFPRGIRTKYKDIVFRSTWEVKVAKWFDDNNVKWEYETKRCIFKLSNGHLYTIDFYLSELDKFIEVKGWGDKKSIFKVNDFNSVHNNLFIIDSSNIKNITLTNHCSNILKEVL